MTRRALRIFFALWLAGAMDAAPVVGHLYAIDIVDLVGNKFAIADGRITTLVVACSNESERAQRVGENTPDYCLANPKYRMITALEFSSHHSAPMRALIRKLAQRRVEAAARSLQARYDANKIKAHAQQDVIVAADFDNAVAAHLEIPLGEHTFAVLVFNSRGELVQQWSDVPTRDALDAALRRAQ